MRIALLLLAGALATRSAAQTGTHHDVAVIVNLNSPASVTIGDYFMAARGIPASRRIAISAPLTNEIDSLQFAQVRAQIEDALLQSGALDSINCLVTTLGIPVRVQYAASGLAGTVHHAAFDSELSLILGPLANGIGGIGWVQNPYWESAAPFSRAGTGIFLVTRLAATTVPDVLALIDRSGTVEIDPATCLLIADNNLLLQPPWILDEPLQQVLEPFATGPWMVQTAGYDVVLDSLSNVIAYVAVNGDPPGFVPDFDWLPGGIYCEGTSYAAVAFENAGAQPNNALLAKVISAGATGARGSAAITYGSDIASFQTTLLSYLDTSYAFNLGESLLTGIRRLSWGEVLIGDPKTRIRYADPFAAAPEREPGRLAVWPNPSPGCIEVRTGRCPPRFISASDAHGRPARIWFEAQGATARIAIPEAAAGIYALIIIDACGNRLMERVLVTD